MNEKKWLVIGKLTKPHGLKGEIRMHYYGNDPDALIQVKTARILKSNKAEHDLEIEKMRRAKNAVIVKFKGIDSIDDAQCYLQSLVKVSRSELGSLEDDEYYYDDLIGMRVFDEQDELVGELTSIFETGGNDVYVVKRGKKELMIPAIEGVVIKVDVDNKKISVHLLEGMRDEF